MIPAVRGTLLSLLLSIPCAAGPLAVVLRVDGAVSVATDTGSRTPRAGDLLLSKWRVATGPDGRIRMRLLADRTVVDLKPSSILELDLLRRADRTLRSAFLLSGEAGISLGDESSDFRARTQTSELSGRLAQFEVSTGPDGSTRIDVSDGTISVCNPGTGDHATAPAGTTTESDWYGISDPVQTAPATDSAFSVEIRMTDPASGESSRLRYGLDRAR